MTTILERIARRELIALSLAAILIVAGDFLCWGTCPGISLGIFLLLAASALLAVRAPSLNHRAAIAFLLLLPAAVQTGIEQSFSNVVALSGLIVVILGETAFEDLRAGWPRWSEAIVALCKPVTGWMWLVKLVQQIPLEQRRLRFAANTLLRVIFPATALALVFAFFLGVGNAIVGQWISNGLSGILSWLERFDLSIGRVFLWLFLATFALTLLRRQILPNKSRFWTRAVPEFSAPSNPTIALWRSVLILALLNILFFVANTADALYLWTNAKLPAGVSYSAFVHSGVYSLSAAVVLSGVVLAFLFQQAASIRGARSVRALGFIWIAQNFILIAGVVLRLVRYVEAYQLSELRVYVGCFLIPGQLRVRVARLSHSKTARSCSVNLRERARYLRAFLRSAISRRGQLGCALQRRALGKRSGPHIGCRISGLVRRVCRSVSHSSRRNTKSRRSARSL